MGFAFGEQAGPGRTQGLLHVALGALRARRVLEARGILQGAIQDIESVPSTPVG